MMSKKGVKTRHREKEIIRKIDKTAIFHDKLKRTYVKMKDRAGNNLPEDTSPTEYAVNTTNRTGDSVIRRGSHRLNAAGKQSAAVTKNKLTGATRRIQQGQSSSAVKDVRYRKTVRRTTTRLRRIPAQTERTVNMGKRIQVRKLAQHRLYHAPRAVARKRKALRKVAQTVKRTAAVAKAFFAVLFAGGWLMVLTILFLCLFGAAIFLFGHDDTDENLYTGEGILGLPIAGMTQADISSPYGSRPSPGGVGSTNHQGIDIAFPLGTDVLASESGTVILAGDNGGFGKCVIINHGKGLQTVYGHMSRIKCKTGEKVVRGQPIGEVGSIGVSTGNHLHFAVRINGNYVNPERGWLDFTK